MDALALVIYIGSLALGLVILYFVIKAAILAALVEDRRRTQQTAYRPTATHLDADGL